MKLTHLRIQDFLGVRAVDMPLTKPVTLICGANASGKSSIRDAVALALTADLARVGLKKEAGQLVRSGANCATTTARSTRSTTSRARLPTRRT
jgi:DNA repair exonuclease SbcCD ATPase subunit